MPGYDWRDDSGNVDASQSGYNYSTGTSHGNSNNNNNNNNNNNYYSNPDDNYDDSWESEVQTGDDNVYQDLKDTYIPPHQVYGPTGDGYVPGKTGYAFTKFDPKILEGIDPKVLAFFGYTGGPNIPVELLKMIAEGSILGGPEAGNSNEEGTGTYSDMEYGSHPLSGFYQQIMNQQNFIPIGSGQQGGGGGYGYGYGNRGRSGGISSRSAQPTIDPYNPEFGRWGQSTVQGDFIRSLKNRGGIISIVR
jgi:hypothetical protein